MGGKSLLLTNESAERKLIHYTSYGIDSGTGKWKKSNPVSFATQSGKDYCVTYLLESPSVYLIAPSYYDEFHFDGP